jgi:hypothetical protein
MSRASLAFMAVMLFASPASASDAADAVAKVRQFVDAWDKGDAPTIEASTAPSLAIIDDYPPYHWGAPNALARWNERYEALTKTRGIKAPSVTLAEPTVIEAKDGYAYVVVPAVYTYTEQERPVRESAIVTLSLQKLSEGWRITAFAWTKQ